MTKPHRLLNLDILRLVSAVMVMLFHYGFRMNISGEGGGLGFPELAGIAQWFDAGLLVFFAISGYVIALSAEGRTAYDFALGRFARLWPTFFLCCTISALILTAWPVPTLAPPTWTQWLAHLVILSRALGQPFIDGAYWTIAYEIIFYGWVFVLIASGLFERHWKPVVAAWLAISAVNEAVLHIGPLQKLFITQYSGYFAFGLMLYRCQRERTPGSQALLGAAALWAIGGSIVTEPDFLATYGFERNPTGVLLMGPLSLALVMLAVLAPPLPIRKGMAVALGGLTYPLYLLHQNIGYATFAHLGTQENRWLVLPCLVAALMLAALVIARFVEPAARTWIIRTGRQMATTSARKSESIFGKPDA